METTYAKYLLKVNSCIRIKVATEKRITVDKMVGLG